jgi:hypothetical protein
MNKILKRIRTMKPEDLAELSEAVSLELQRRMKARKAIETAVEEPASDRQDVDPSVLPIPVAAPGPRRAA